MKKFIFGALLVLLFSFNLFVSSKSNDRFSNLSNFLNTAVAESEGGGEQSFTCYSAGRWTLTGSYLSCNTPCCYKDGTPTLTGGKCTGTFSDC